MAKQPSDESERAQLVEILWNLKQAFRKHGTGSLRLTVVQFNWLLNDPDYRESVLKRAESSGIEPIQLLAAQARLLNRHERLVTNSRFKEAEPTQQRSESDDTRNAHAAVEHAYAANTEGSIFSLGKDKHTLLNFPNAHKFSSAISIDSSNRIFTVHRSGSYLIRYHITQLSSNAMAPLNVLLLVNGAAIEAANLSESPSTLYHHLSAEVIQSIKAESTISLRLEPGDCGACCSQPRTLKFLEQERSTLDLTLPLASHGASLTIMQLE